MWGLLFVSILLVEVLVFVFMLISVCFYCANGGTRNVLAKLIDGLSCSFLKLPTSHKK